MGENNHRHISFARWCSENISDDFIERYWCYDLNKDIDPFTISCMYAKSEIYLKCDKGYDHVYHVQPRGFVVGSHSCRICNNKIILKGFNDLFTIKPELKDIWNFEKNIDISPYEVSYCSSKKVWWKCEYGHEWEATISNTTAGHRCPKCAKEKLSKQQRMEHNEFCQRLYNVNPNIKVIGQYSGSNKKVLCQCKIDGYKWDAWPTHLIRGHRCPVCANRVVVSGVNDVATTHSYIIEYFKNKEEATKYTYSSKHVIDAICPDCGYEKQISLNHLTKDGFACPICSDGVLYPNKFMRNILRQLQIDFIPEFSPPWLNQKLFDFYFSINNIDYIVEMDGGLGHGYGKHGRSKLTVDELKTIDIEKDRLAAEHGMHVIRIDCNYKHYDRYKYILNNVINSQLSEIFDLSIVDFDYCNAASQRSIVKSVCNFYNDTGYSLKQLSNIFKLSANTIRKYLKIGNNCGWCSFG